MDNHPSNEGDSGLSQSGMCTYQVTVLGLGRVGRQVALGLTALGVPQLHLVDAGKIQAETQLAEGYSYEDIGRPRVQAVAQACHQLNPGLEIHTQEDSSIGRVRESTAIFLCPGMKMEWADSLKDIYQGGVFLAQCWLTDTFIHMSFRQALSIDHKEVESDCRARVVAGSDMAAALLVSEFTSYCKGTPPRKHIQFDMQSCFAVVSL